MRPLFETVTDLRAGAEILRTRAYGVIEAVEGRFRRVRLRPFPKLVSAPQILLWGGWYHRNWPGDRCLLYYNQPRRFRNFLALRYVVSTRRTALGTLNRVLETLDEIARLKGTDAVLCDVASLRITSRIMSRWGWEPHCQSRWHKHHIKRFYGDYPPPAAWIQQMAGPGGG